MPKARGISRNGIVVAAVAVLPQAYSPPSLEVEVKAVRHAMSWSVERSAE